MGNAGIGTLGSAPTAAALDLKANKAGDTLTNTTVNELTPTRITQVATAILPPVANNFDPCVTDYATLSTGFTPIIGSVVGTLDGTKSWQKWGAGALQWAPLHAVSGTFGADAATFDIPVALAGDTLGPVEVEAVIQISTDTSGGIGLRINGGAATGWIGSDGVNNVSGASAAQGTTVTIGANLAPTNDFLHVILRISPIHSSSPIRCLQGSFQTISGANRLHDMFSVILTNAGEITSFGFARVSTGLLASASTWSVRR